MERTHQTKMKWIIFGLVTLVVLLACLFAFRGRVKKPGEIPGVYDADYKLAQEQLTLNEDGTFEQRVTLKSTGKVDLARGTWTFDAIKGYVRFDGEFMQVMNGFQQLNPSYADKATGHGALPADRIFGRVQIGAAEGVLYTKRKPSK
jgi:hypothetical protein